MKIFVYYLNFFVISGTLSIEEISSVVYLAMKVKELSSRYHGQNFGDFARANGDALDAIISEIKPLIDDVMHLLGGTTKGVLEAYEISDFLMEIITLVENIIKQVLHLFVNVYKDVMRAHFISVMIDQLNRNSIMEANGNLDIDSTVKKLVAMVTSNYGPVIVEAFNPMQYKQSLGYNFVCSLLFPGTLTVLNLLEKQVVALLPADTPNIFVPPILPSNIADIIEGFFSKFEREAARSATRGSLPKHEVARMISEAIEGFYHEYLNTDCLLLGFSASLMLISSFIGQAFAGGYMVKPRLLTDIFRTMAESFETALLGGGLSKVISAILSFIDLNGDGQISHDELFGLYDAGINLLNSFVYLHQKARPAQGEDDQQALRLWELTKSTRYAAFERCLGVFFKRFLCIFDSNGDGIISKSDFEAVFEKFFEIFNELILVAFMIVKTVAGSTLKILFSSLMKFKQLNLGGGSNLTSDEIVRKLKAKDLKA